MRRLKAISAYSCAPKFLLYAYLEVFPTHTEHTNQNTKCKVASRMTAVEDLTPSAGSDVLRADVRYAQEHDLQTLSIYTRRQPKDDEASTVTIPEHSKNSTRLWVM